MPVENPVRLRLLGGFSVTVGGENPRPVDISSPRHRALLAYLALRPDYSESRERLVALLWGDSPEGDARKRFRQSLLRLRRELESAGVDLLISGRDTLALDPAALTVDAREFAALSGAASADDLAAAPALYGGDLLDGLSLEAESFDTWLSQERARFRAIAMQVLERCVVAREQIGDADGAILAAERLVALDPLNEGPQRQLIDLLSRHRGRTAALAQAEMAKRLVSEEFDSELEPETVQLIERLKSPATTIRPVEHPVDKILSGDQRPDPGPGMRAARSDDLPDDRPAAGEPATDPPVPAAQSGRFAARRIWRPALASLAVIGAIFAYVVLQTPWEPVSNRAAAAYPPDNGWRSPSPVVPSAAVSQAVQGRGASALLVLPFTAVPADSGQAKLMSGLLSNDLVNDLSRVPSLRIIARSTSLQYAKPPVDVAAIGTELGVQYVVEGDVRVDGTTVRINIALIDTRTRLHVWTERYERDDTDRPKVQDEIVRALARQLQVSMMEVRGREPTNPTIDSMLGKGWAALNQFAFFRGGHDSAQLFQDVLALDPKNVSALTGLGAFKSVAYNTRQTTDDRDSLLRDSENLLKQALRVNPQASLPLYFLGRRAMWQGEPDEALDYFARTLNLNPSYAPAYGAIGYVLLHTNRLQEALDNLMYAIRLSPKDHYLGLWSAHVGRIHFELGQFDEAEHWLSLAVRLMPGSTMNRAALAAFHTYRDNPAAADAQIVELKKLGSGATSADLIGRFTALCRQDDHKPKRLLGGLNKVFASIDSAR
jgi:TolB-like protein/DNA-binding SARP family transcriptional activator